MLQTSHGYDHPSPVKYNLSKIMTARQHAGARLSRHWDTEHDFGSSVVPCRHNRSVVVMLVSGAAEVNHDNVVSRRDSNRTTPQLYRLVRPANKH